MERRSGGVPPRVPFETSARDAYCFDHLAYCAANQVLPKPSCERRQSVTKGVGVCSLYICKFSIPGGMKGLRVRDVDYTLHGI
jgi:hypothetical protein